MGRRVAVLGCSLMFLIGYLFARRAHAPRYLYFASGLAGLVLVQMALGDIQYRTHLPWWLVLVHVAVAATVWAATGRACHTHVAPACGLREPAHVDWSENGGAQCRSPPGPRASGPDRRVPRLERRRPGCSLAAGYLAKAWDARRFAEIDPEGFFDFQSTRPQVRLEEGFTRRIDWPETVFYHARPEGLERDAVLLLGIEPNLRWRTFSGLIVDFAKELGVELMVTLGALLADVPHTRDAPVTGSATDASLIEQLGLQASRYEGPTGIVGRRP
jgi:hypothetical protein